MLYEYDQGKMACKTCLGNRPDIIAKIVREKRQSIEAGKYPVSSGNSGNGAAREVTITSPGVPPPELSLEERDYYKQRWEDYKGHYRSPASFHVCHMIILEEICLNYLNKKMIETKGQLQFETYRERQQSAVMLKNWHELLPEKEAQDLMDDEKAINSMYQAYIEELGKTRCRGISRILSPAAIALAPILPFPLDLNLLLKKLGYNTIEIEEAISKIEIPPENMNALEMAEWFGFRPRQEYALPPDSPLLQESDLERDNEEQYGEPEQMES